MFSTSSTFTSLYKLASMRRAWSWSASTVMVMRDTSGFSVRPTVSESILKARRRNSEATRVSTPGLFSTYTMNVFSIFFVRLLLAVVGQSLLLGCELRAASFEQTDASQLVARSAFIRHLQSRQSGWGAESCH